MRWRDGEAAFVFAAQGTEWPGMGRDLLREDAAFRDVIVRCDVSIRRHFDWSLLEELEAGSPRLRNDTSVIQPALTSLQIAIAEMLRAHGIAVAAVGALSMGEAAAACCAGALDLDAAIDVACSTARLTETTLRRGSMMFVRAPWDACAALIAGVADRVALAVELGRHLTVISGEELAVRGVMAAALARGIACGPLPLAQAYHSPDVASLGEGFKARLSGLRVCAPRLPLYSSVTAEPLADAPSVEHWWRICSEPALFYSLARNMIAAGCRRFVEIGPHPMLAQTIEEAAADLGAVVEIAPVMLRGAGSVDCLAAMTQEPASVV